MKNFTRFMIYIFLTLDLLTGCTTINNKSIEKTTNNPESTQIKPIVDQRYESAFDAYPVALAKALEWDQNAVLYEIPSTEIISGNISLITYGPYWFFIFETSSTQREFYIAISNGETAGSFQAQPIVTEELSFTKYPLEINSYIDSDEILQLCADYGDLNIDELIKNEKEIDYRLVNIDNQAVWSIFIIEDEPFSPICNINAVTGERTSDPYE